MPNPGVIEVCLDFVEGDVPELTQPVGPGRRVELAGRVSEAQRLIREVVDHPFEDDAVAQTQHDVPVVLLEGTPATSWMR